jgi:hypothetical protein
VLGQLKAAIRSTGQLQRVERLAETIRQLAYGPHEDVETSRPMVSQLERWGRFHWSEMSEQQRTDFVEFAERYVGMTTPAGTPLTWKSLSELIGATYPAFSA